jgi:hypothetical protein
VKIEGERIAPASLPLSSFTGMLRQHVCMVRFGGADLGSRLVLLVIGVAALTAARTASFIGQVPSDRFEPRVPPLIWLFHVADASFLPGVNKLPGLTPTAYIQFVALALALACFFLAARATVPALLRRWYRPLAVVALLLTPLLLLLNLQGVFPYFLVVGSPNHYGNDAISVTSCGTDEFLRNQNPYTAFRVVPCLSKSFAADMVAIKTTPLEAGAFSHHRYWPDYPTKEQLVKQFHLAQQRHEAYPREFESYFSYPAASFLLPAIFVAAHIHDLSIFYLLCYLAVAGLVLWRTSGAARWVALIVVVVNAALWPTISAGDTDALYALLVLLAWVWRDQRWVSVLAFGLAAATRQQAWFYLVFYSVLIWREQGRRESLLRLGIIGGICVGLNLPYFIASPGAWLAGVLGPMRDPMFPRGTGIIALSIYGQGSLPLGPRWLYGVLEAVALVGSAWYYWRTCRKHPGTGLILAPLALFFAWRSLYSYFLPLSLLVLYPALVDHGRPKEPLRVGASDDDADARGGTEIAA